MLIFEKSTLHDLRCAIDQPINKAIEGEFNPYGWISLTSFISHVIFGLL